MPETWPSPAACLTRVETRLLALESGFAEAGLVALPYASEARDAGRFEEWVRAGCAGTMRYLERTTEAGELARARVRNAFPWARSALVCFASYDSAHPRSTEPAAPGAGWIARYAWTRRTDASGERRPSDYHRVLLKRLKSLEAQLHAQMGSFEARAYVDTGPLVERALATAAGFGWTGKNTCLIHPRMGSYGFLGVLLTSLPVREDEAPVMLAPDRCGSCRRCLDACPTGALTAPYQMDARQCIAYLTIEHKGSIAEELMDGMGRQVFGCDICQDVCPWNRGPLRNPRRDSPNQSLLSVDPELEPRAELVNPALEWLASLDESSFEREFNGSPVRRPGFWGLKRNTAIAMGNSGEVHFAPWLETWAEAADEGLRTAARWALKKLGW